jgi:hypothetical protein
MSFKDQSTRRLSQNIFTQLSHPNHLDMANESCSSTCSCRAEIQALKEQISGLQERLDKLSLIHDEDATLREAHFPPNMQLSFHHLHRPTIHHPTQSGDASPTPIGEPSPHEEASPHRVRHHRLHSLRINRPSHHAHRPIAHPLHRVTTHSPHSLKLESIQSSTLHIPHMTLHIHQFFSIFCMPSI